MSAIAAVHAEPNGGFPLPLGGGARILAIVHDSCGAVTAIRLPSFLPVAVVSRVSCAGCSQTYACDSVIDLDVEVPPDRPLPARSTRSVSLPSLPSLPSLSSLSSLPRPRLPRLGRGGAGGSASTQTSRERWLRIAALPLSAAAVIAILLAVRGGEESLSSPDGARASGSSSSATANGEAAKALQKAGKNASMVSGASFSLALPPGWKQIEPSSGASFAAVAPGGMADATLWIERDPDLSFSDFEARSLDQLEQLAGSASVVERVSAPTEEASLVRLAADRPEGSPAYEVLLRASGPYRYYLATTLDPEASSKDAEALELIGGSLVPTAAGEG